MAPLAGDAASALYPTRPMPYAGSPKPSGQLYAMPSVRSTRTSSTATTSSSTLSLPMDHSAMIHASSAVSSAASSTDSSSSSSADSSSPKKAHHQYSSSSGTGGRLSAFVEDTPWGVHNDSTSRTRATPTHGSSDSRSQAKYHAQGSRQPPAPRYSRPVSQKNSHPVREQNLSTPIANESSVFSNGGGIVLPSMLDNDDGAVSDVLSDRSSSPATSDATPPHPSPSTNLYAPPVGREAARYCRGESRSGSAPRNAAADEVRRHRSSGPSSARHRAPVSAGVDSVLRNRLAEQNGVTAASNAMPQFPASGSARALPSTEPRAAPRAISDLHDMYITSKIPDSPSDALRPRRAVPRVVPDARRPARNGGAQSAQGPSSLNSRGMAAPPYASADGGFARNDSWASSYEDDEDERLETLDSTAPAHPSNKTRGAEINVPKTIGMLKLPEPTTASGTNKATSTRADAEGPVSTGPLSRRWNSAMRMISMNRGNPTDEPRALGTGDSATLGATTSYHATTMRGSVVHVAPPTLGERLRVGGNGAQPAPSGPNSRRGRRMPGQDEVTKPNVDRARHFPPADEVERQGDDYIGFLVEQDPLSTIERKGPKRWLRNLMRRR